jgi:hypothetical protein
MNRPLCIILSIIAFCGCSQQYAVAVRPLSTLRLGDERVFDKNYQVGQKQAAVVGQPIVKVKDYVIERYRTNKMRATDNFVITGGPTGFTITTKGDKGLEYSIRGETTLDGKNFMVVNVPLAGVPDFGALVDNEGYIYHRSIIRNEVLIFNFTVQPDRVRFLPVSEEKINRKAGYLNYELLYGGTDGKSIIINYREYTSADVARPAFYQNLVYESKAEYIRFKNIRIRVHEATSEKIVYTIERDDAT